jgi:hypothetical protein
MASLSAVLVILGIVAFVAGWWYLEYRVGRGRRFSPLWMAFSFTAAAVLFLTTGVAGYVLDKQDRFAYTGEVIWSQVAIGLGAAVLAALLWTLALRRMGNASSEAK